MVTSKMLSGFNLFLDATEEVLDEIAKNSEINMAEKDSFVFREGDRADTLYLLLSGSISLRVKLTSRPDSVTVSFLNNPHQILGWSGVVAPNHYTASAYCEENTELIAIPSDKFMEILDHYPEAGYKIMLRITQVISDRLRNSRQALLKTI